jgi:Zn finger protein HypA/HybF involved in hydrogenase expression
MESRYEDCQHIKCEDCGWTGRVSECYHGYTNPAMEHIDVEPIDMCPECGSDNLTIIKVEYI